eukprot:5906143-Prorocentrum_lima.AAC.1
MEGRSGKRRDDGLCVARTRMTPPRHVTLGTEYHTRKGMTPHRHVTLGTESHTRFSRNTNGRNEEDKA